MLNAEDLYESQHWRELDLRDKIDSRLQSSLTLVTAIIGALSFLLTNVDIGHTHGLADYLFFTLLAITFALLGALGWAAPARVIRAAVRKLRGSDFMLLAEAHGSTPWRLLWRQLIPNMMPILLAQFWIAVPAYILAETTLGMLGLGIAEPLPSWGGLLRELEGGDAFSRWWLLAPALLLAVVTGSLQMLRPRREQAI